MTKKGFLLALALMLTAMGGAWAQNSWQSSSSQASNTVALADITVTFNGEWSFTNDYAKGSSSNGQTITIEPTADGDFMLVFGGSIGDTKPIHMMNDAETTYVVGTKVGAPDVTVEGSGVAFESGEGIVYALEAGVAYTFSVGAMKWRLASFSFAPAPEPELLTWDAATRTGSLTMPAGNVTLTVTYYGQYRLDSIPQGWQVKVNGTLMGSDTLKAYTEGNPQMRYIAAITETDTVELIPPADVKPIVKNVTLVEPLLSINVSGHKIYYSPGETWEQAITNHPIENAGWYTEGSYVYFDVFGSLNYDEPPYGEVGRGENIDPNRSYYLGN